MKDAMKALRAHAKKPASQAHGPGAKLAMGGMAKYNQGGVTTEMAQDMGRNMARARNQGAVGRKKG
jgi:hypothetical protein